MDESGSSVKPRARKNALIILAAFLFASAATALIVAPPYSIYKGWAGIACIAAVFLVRSAKGPSSKNTIATPAVARPNGWMWAIGFALLALMAASYFALIQDGRLGGHVSWPLYLFVAVTIACAIFWGYLFASNI